jgi:hypothetical protein
MQVATTQKSNQKISTSVPIPFWKKSEEPSEQSHQQLADCS